MPTLNEIVTSVNYLTLVVNNAHSRPVVVTSSPKALTTVTSVAADQVLQIGTPGAQGPRGYAGLSLLRTVNTFAIRGPIATSSGPTDSNNYIPPFFISLTNRETAKLAKCQYVIGAGTSVTCKLTQNGIDIPDFTGMVVTPLVSSTVPSSVDLFDGDEIALVVTGTSGAAANLSLTVVFEYIVT